MGSSSSSSHIFAGNNKSLKTWGNKQLQLGSSTIINEIRNNCLLERERPYLHFFVCLFDTLDKIFFRDLASGDLDVDAGSAVDEVDRRDQDDRIELRKLK